MMALEGIRVLDLTRQAPGPFCTMILADLGAEVIRIEEVGEPSGRRAKAAGAAGVSYDMPVSIESPYNALNRNKKSIALNLKSGEGKDVIYKLTRDADVLVEEMRPGVSKRLGIDYETLQKLNPKLVYCSISNYGQDGPYKALPGHDINCISFAGALSLIGERQGRPVVPLNFLADYGGGMHAASGIMAALLVREKTSMGQYVDVSMTDCVVMLMASIYAEYFATGFIPERGKHVSSGGVPYVNLYRTMDRKYITIACPEPWFFANLCHILGRDDLITKQHSLGEDRKELYQTLADIFYTKTRDEWFEILSKADVPVGKVLDLKEAIEDPQLQSREMFVELEHPQLGKIRQVGISPKFSRTPGSIRHFPPKRGEHTDILLKDIGYRDEEIVLLRSKGCVG